MCFCRTNTAIETRLGVLPASQHGTAVVSTAGEAAAANGPAEEPHLPAHPGPAGRTGPDRHAENREDGPGVPAGEHSGRKYCTELRSHTPLWSVREREKERESQFDVGVK